MSVFHVLAVLAGLFLSNSLFSLTLYSGQNTKLFTNHAAKVFSSFCIVLIACHCWHQTDYLILVPFFYFLLSPILWKYDFYGELFDLVSFKPKEYLIIYAVSLSLSLSIIYFLKRDLSFFSLIANQAIPFHLTLLSFTFYKIKKQSLKRNLILNRGLTSIRFEFFYFGCLQVFLLFEYGNHTSLFITCTSILLLVLLGLTLIPQYKSYIELKNTNDQDKELINKEILSRLKDNVELENKLSTYSHQANLLKINRYFLKRIFSRIKTLVEKDKRKASLILIKLSKHMRNAVHYDYKTAHSYNTELKVLEDFLKVVELSFNTPKVMLSQPDNLNNPKIKSLALCSLIFQGLSQVIKHSDSCILNISIKEQDNNITCVLEATNQSDFVWNYQELGISQIQIGLKTDNKDYGNISDLENNSFKIRLNFIEND